MPSIGIGLERELLCLGTVHVCSIGKRRVFACGRGTGLSTGKSTGRHKRESARVASTGKEHREEPPLTPARMHRTIKGNRRGPRASSGEEPALVYGVPCSTGVMCFDSHTRPFSNLCNVCEVVGLQHSLVLRCS